MAGIGAVNNASVAQVASPQQSTRTGPVQGELGIPGQADQGDVLTISSKGLKALEDSESTLVVHKHRHKALEVDLNLLTYPNFQLKANNPVAAVQNGTALPGTAAPVAAAGPAGGAGGAGAGGGAGAAGGGGAGAA